MNINKIKFECLFIYMSCLCLYYTHIDTLNKSTHLKRKIFLFCCIHIYISYPHTYVHLLNKTTHIFIWLGHISFFFDFFFSPFILLLLLLLVNSFQWFKCKNDTIFYIYYYLFFLWLYELLYTDKHTHTLLPWFTFHAWILN